MKLVPESGQKLTKASFQNPFYTSFIKVYYMSALVRSCIQGLVQKPWKLATYQETQIYIIQNRYETVYELLPLTHTVSLGKKCDYMIVEDLVVEFVTLYLKHFIYLLDGAYLSYHPQALDILVSTMIFHVNIRGHSVYREYFS